MVTCLARRAAPHILLVVSICVAAWPQPANAQAGAPIRIDPRPRTTVGVIEGDTMQELHRVITPFALRDGRIVVPLGTARSVRVFAPNGAFVRAYGRVGGGPGEFRDIGAAWPRGDTIEVFDFRLRRITRFRPDGEVETVTLQAAIPDLSASVGPFGAGWAAGGVAVGGAGRRDSVVVHRFDRSGKDLGVIAHVHGMKRYAAGPEPLSPRSIHAVNNNRVYIAESLTPRISVIASNGARGDIRWQARAGSIRQALNTVIDSAVRRAGPENATVTRERITAAGTPDRLPAFGDFLVDARGYVWVSPYDPLKHSFALGSSTGRGGEWLIFAPDGRAAGSIAVPADIEPTFISENAIVGIGRDEFGVEYVRVYPLARR